MLVALDIYLGLVRSVENAVGLMRICVRDTHIEKVEACGTHVHEDVLWSGHRLWRIMHEGEFRRMLPFFDYVGPHSETALFEIA